MAKIVINDIESGFMSQNAINEAFNTVEQELNNKVLYRDNPSGEPNQMENNLDMNDFDVINVGLLSADNVTIAGTDLGDAIQDVADALDSIAPAVTAAQTAATNAANSASSASSSASSASSSASSAASAATSTAASLAAFEVLLDTFDDRYLGAKASDPTVDNDGNPLVAGTVYYNTTDNELKFYNGTTWESPSASAEASATNALNSANAAATSASNASSSATAASVARSAAQTSATNAATSATAAASSASNASSSASSALTNANNAASSANNSAASATLANDWATKTSGPVAGGEYSAKYHAQAAATSETNAATSASNASSSASSATSSASSAASSASSASNSASSASTSASNAATSESNTASLYDQFDDRYLGNKSSDPSVDNDGNALLEGALYWNTSSKLLKIYNGTAWQDTTINLASPPAIGNTTPSTGAFTTLISTGQSSFGGDTGSESLRVIAPSVTGAWLLASSASNTARLRSASDSGTTAMWLSSVGAEIRFQTNSWTAEQARVAHTASAVNYVQVTGATTTNRPTISSQGSDTNVGLNIQSKNSGAMIFTRQRDAVNSSQYLYEFVGGLNADSNGGAFWRGFHLGAPNYTVSGSNRFPRMAQYFELQSATNPTYTNAYYAIGNANGLNIEGVFSNESGGGWTFKNASSFSSDISFRIATPLTTNINYLQVAGAVTNQEPLLSAQGSDTNINIGLQSKGTGSIDLVSGSTGVNVSNGTTVTAITSTAGGSNYTSLPSVVISAPNIAGGVQATASPRMNDNGSSLVSGGTGYTVGNILSVSGLTGGTVTYTVTAVSSGVITAFTQQNYGQNSVTAFPSNPVSVTGGTGSGATFNINWAVRAFTITNAGSGYTSVPTVTFSGGGGSGASAFAQVGTTAAIRGTAATLQLSTNMGAALDLTNYGQNQTTNRYALFASATGNPAIIEPRGDTNVDAIMSSRGTGNVRFFTNGASGGAAPEQMRVSHTASAVNYVQVTGNATGGAPIISAQGSDAVLGLSLVSKSASILFTTRVGSQRAFNIADSANTANWLQVQGAATGVAPILSSQGTDTNIDLSLASKGTGGIVGSINSGTFAFTRDTGNNAIKLTATNTANLYLQSTGGGAVLVNTSDTVTTQLRVTHTASAVNFIQATGGVTGSPGQVLLTAQGSDANVNFIYRSKGTGNHIFQNSSGNWLFRSANPAGTLVNNLVIAASVTGSAPYITSEGADTNVDLTLITKGTGAVNLNTGNGTAFRASQAFLTGTAVNYIDASGRQTGLGPILSVNGSDTNVRFNITSKGNEAVGLYTNLANQLQFNVTHTASAVNYVQVTGSATGGEPTVSAQGSDANINLRLSSKGTGNVTVIGGLNVNAGGNFSVDTSGNINRLSNAIYTYDAGANTEASRLIYNSGTSSFTLTYGGSTRVIAPYIENTFQFTYVTSPSNSNTSVTVTAGNIQNGILTGTPTANINYTLPTGTNMDSNFSTGVNGTAEWSIINLASATHSITVLGNTGHTLVGNMVVAANSSARFASRKTGTNTYVTYRLS